jgi:hypothetical protein
MSAQGAATPVTNICSVAGNSRKGAKLAKKLGSGVPVEPETWKRRAESHMLDSQLQLVSLLPDLVISVLPSLTLRVAAFVRFGRTNIYFRENPKDKFDTALDG